MSFITKTLVVFIINKFEEKPRYRNVINEANRN